MEIEVLISSCLRKEPSSIVSQPNIYYYNLDNANNMSKINGFSYLKPSKRFIFLQTSGLRPIEHKLGTTFPQITSYLRFGKTYVTLASSHNEVVLMEQPSIWTINVLSCNILTGFCVLSYSLMHFPNEYFQSFVDFTQGTIYIFFSVQ